MKKFSKIMVILTGFFAISLFNSAVLNAEMIEPTRTLKKTSADPGQLTVFSEPPGQVVKIDGAPVGKTPLRIQPKSILSRAQPFILACLRINLSNFKLSKKNQSNNPKPNGIQRLKPGLRNPLLNS